MSDYHCDDNKCPQCKVFMKPLKYKGEKYYRCPKCKYYHGCFYSSLKHPRHEATMTAKYENEHIMKQLRHLRWKDL